MNEQNMWINFFFDIKGEYSRRRVLGKSEMTTAIKEI